MSYPQPISAQDKKWRAEDDARTLAEAERIKVDKSRMDAASTAAKRMADEEAERTQALRKVAKKTTTIQKRSSTHRTIKKPAKKPDSFNLFERI